MLFWWGKSRRRRKIKAQPFPDSWLAILKNNVHYYHVLTESEQAQLRDDLRIFAEEKNWEGCRGVTITEEMKVTIAAQACLLLLGIEHDYFDRVLSILVYPSSFFVGSDAEEMSSRDAEELLGEAWYRGPVILSWEQVKHDGKEYRDGRNVVLHEFAHQLDFLDGMMDGTPPLKNREQYRRWHDVMTAEYNALVEASEHGRATLLDQYGATNPPEMFAVCTECFFESPLKLEKRHPQLYQVLRDYYGQDPARRFRERHS